MAGKPERREDDTALALKYQYRVLRRVLGGEWYYDHTDSDGYDFFVTADHIADPLVGRLFNTIEEALKVCTWKDVIEVAFPFDQRYRYANRKPAKVHLV